MKQTKKTALCAITVAISSAVMLVSFFPYLTYAVPAASGLFMMLPLIAINAKYAFASYIASAIFIMLFAEPEAAVLYLCIFGYYPILKAVIEKLHKPIAEWLIKFLVFNFAAVLSYFITSKIFGISFDDFEKIGKYGAFCFLGICNIVFVIYDIAISRVSFFYIQKIHRHIKKFMDN